MDITDVYLTDFDLLLANMAEANRKECEAFYETVAEAVDTCVDGSYELIAIRDEGRLIAVGGLSPGEGDYSEPWMLCTDEVSKRPIAFFHTVQRLLKRYPEPMLQLVHKSNKFTQLLFTKCDFELTGEAGEWKLYQRGAL